MTINAKQFGNRPFAQGELMFRKIEKLPVGLDLDKAKNGAYLVGHSESGDHHIVLERQAQHLIDKTNAFISYIKVNPVKALKGEECLIDHLRKVEGHEAYALEPGAIYEVIHQIESGPKGWQRAAD